MLKGKILVKKSCNLLLKITAGDGTADQNLDL